MVLLAEGADTVIERDFAGGFFEVNVLAHFLHLGSDTAVGDGKLIGENAVSEVIFRYGIEVFYEVNVVLSAFVALEPVAFV